MAKKSATTGSTLFFLTALSILAVLCQGASAQLPYVEGYDLQSEFTTEVLLNKPGLTFDFDALNDTGRNLNIVYEKWDGGPYYIYRSHNDKDLAVVIYDAFIAGSEGISINLIIPTEWVQVNETVKELVSSVDLQPGDVDWAAAMAAELQWLLKESIIGGIDADDIAVISSRVGPGYAGRNSRIIFFNNTWMPKNETGLLDLVPIMGGGFQLGSDEMPPGDGREGWMDSIVFFVLFAVAALVLLMVLGAFAYTRLKRRNLLDNLNRNNIYEHIKENPGVHFRELLRELSFKPGAMSYHLNVLEKGEFIKSSQDGNYRRYYLVGVKSDLKIALNQMQLRILSIVDERPGISQAKIAKQVGKNRMVVNYHIRLLADADILSVEKSGRENHCYTTKNSDNYLTG